MFTPSEAFDLRSISSVQLSDSELGESRTERTLESIVLEPQGISEIIVELILQQNRKNFFSKTQPFYQPTTIGRRYSASLPHNKRYNMTLPYQLQQMLHNTRKCPNIVTNDLMDSIYGAFFGFVIGDIVGGHLAYKLYNVPQIPAALLMNGGGTYNIGPGQGTDQTQIMLSTCYGLLQGGDTYSPDHMARAYLKWLQSKPFNVSAIFVLSFVEIRRKIAQQKLAAEQGLGESLVRFSAKNKNQESNLGLIRILPLVVWGLNLSEGDFSQLIEDQMALICPNPLVLETALVYALILRTIFKTRDHELAFYQASKRVYSRGSDRLKQLWRYVESDVQIQSRGNVGKLKTSFTYACIEINKREVKFMDTLLKTLLKGGDTDANSAIVMALVGAIVGYNSIPAYFKQKIVNSRMSQSCRPRGEEFTPCRIIEIVERLMGRPAERHRSGSWRVK